MATPELIPPALRASLKGLRLQTRTLSHASGLGLHTSGGRGSGVEFVQYRAYEPGDAPRMIDWKLYARADRFFVREAERDSPLEILLLLDTSASMAQQDAQRPNYTRLDAARSLAACVVLLAHQQGEQFSLATINASDGLRLMPAGTGARHRDRCFSHLLGAQALGKAASDAQLRPLWQHTRAGSSVLLLSDGFDDALLDLATRLASARRQVLSVQLLCAEERDFPYEGGMQFHDVEAGVALVGDGKAMRAEFLQRFAQARAELAARFASVGIKHYSHFLDQALELPLRYLFARSAR